MTFERFDLSSVSGFSLGTKSNAEIATPADLSTVSGFSNGASVEIPADDTAEFTTGYPAAITANGANDDRVPPGYVATIRAFMQRWYSLARPELQMPRRLGIGRPYLVDDLGDWLISGIADPPSRAWAPRKEDEIAILDQLLTELEAAQSGTEPPQCWIVGCLNPPTCMAQNGASWCDAHGKESA